MKKIGVILLLPFLFSMAVAGPSKSDSSKEAEVEFVVIEIENTGFSAGKAFLSRQFGTPHYIGRVGPGQTTKIKIPAPIGDNYHTLYVTKRGQVTDSAIIAGEIAAGDKITWDLFSDMIVWESKNAKAESK